MISRVRGALLRREIGLAEVMTASGVAYEMHIPLTVFERLPREGAEVELRTVQVIREDAHELFGFLDDAERVVFARLLSASGVGPRLALAILSAMPPERIVRAIHEKDIAALRRIPGLGVKKAERLVLELADRLDDIATTATGTRSAPGHEEAVSALVALGYSTAEAAAAVRKVVDEHGPLPAIEMIRTALAGMKNR